MKKSNHLLCLILMLATSVMADEKKSAKAKRTPNPAMAKVDDIPGLPRVLLIGDSISIGYTVPVRELLKGKQRSRIFFNWWSTINGLEKLKTWW